jgi:hypothetical protein
LREKGSWEDDQKKDDQKDEKKDGLKAMTRKQSAVPACPEYDLFSAADFPRIAPPAVECICNLMRIFTYDIILPMLCFLFSLMMRAFIPRKSRIKKNRCKVQSLFHN